MESKCSDRKLGSSVAQLICRKRTIVQFKLSLWALIQQLCYTAMNVTRYVYDV